MIRNIFILLIFVILSSCSNTPELETGEIKTIQLLRNLVDQQKVDRNFIDSKILLNRDQIDKFGIPILFIELKSGKNGTLTLYPGRSETQTWLSADGATITLENGILKASRGLGDDIMQSNSSMPSWSKVNNHGVSYTRAITYLNGNNRLVKHLLECRIKKSTKKNTLQIWEATFSVWSYEENCSFEQFKIKNSYYVENNGTVRKSVQYHSKTLGYIKTERLDR